MTGETFEIRSLPPIRRERPGLSIGRYSWESARGFPRLGSSGVLNVNRSELGSVDNIPGVRVAVVQTAEKVQSRPRRTNEKRARPRGQTGEENGKKRKKEKERKNEPRRGKEERNRRRRRRCRENEEKKERGVSPRVSQPSWTLKEFWQIYERETLSGSRSPMFAFRSQPARSVTLAAFF